MNLEDPFLLAHQDITEDGVPDPHGAAEAEQDLQRIAALGANVVRLAVYPGYYHRLGERYFSDNLDRLLERQPEEVGAGIRSSLRADEMLAGIEGRIDVDLQVAQRDVPKHGVGEIRLRKAKPIHLLLRGSARLERLVVGKLRIP